jgi:hypothetical protein
MTRPPLGTFGLGSAALAAALWAADVTPAAAQCATCVTPPTVAYSPVVVQPQTTIVRTGWYPGYLLDRLRLRRWSAVNTTAAVAAAPTYSVGYAPTYTAAYAPAAHTASYTPYITAYAPLQTPVVQTSYYAAPAVSAAAPCTSCAQTTTVAYAPSTVYRPVEVAPVVQTVVAAPACEVPCSPCATGVSQAAYVEGAAVAAPADCPGCAASAGTPEYYSGSSQPPAAPPAGQPETPPPSLKPPVPTPSDSTYGSGTNGTGTNGSSAAEEKSVVPSPGEDHATGPEAEPPLDPAADASTSLDLQAPPLLGPQNDRTANRPTVDVHNAVYRQPVRAAARVSTTAAKATPQVDANGWYSVKDR